METGQDVWHNLAAKETVERQRTDLDRGLSSQEARQRLDRFGPNRLREGRREPIWVKFVAELREPLVLLLLVTGVFYAIWGELADALVIFFVILVLNTIEVYNEQRAGKAVAALRKLAEPTATVRRDGSTVEVAADEIVPGDVLLLQAGRRVPADARLVEAFGLAVDESALTGESVPVDKEARPVLAVDTPLAERRNLVFAGTTATRGRAAAVVVATGKGSEIGRLAGLAAEVKAPRTPLQKSMRELSGSLVWLALGFSVLVPFLGWLLTDQPLQQLVLTGLSLAFATIPEEMPIIITMVLALGAYRLSKQKAIARQLTAVETLGAITVIATDKTGTLTENRMRVSRLYPEGMAGRLLTVGVQCSDPIPDGALAASDPLEVALWQAACEAGLDVDGREIHADLRDEFTFDNERKMMSVVYGRDGGLWVGVKGAPEAVLGRSTGLALDRATLPLDETDREALAKESASMAAGGLRVIALAEKVAPEGDLSQAEAECDLTFLGLIGLADPARPEAGEAIRACRRAGIRPIMITGDHPLTARAIARQVGMDGAILTGNEVDALSDAELGEAAGRVSLYARTTPEHKLRIVRALQERGERVAVTGDGINDAPALVAADIGVAMGETGTDVAREAGDVVLADDNLSTIVRAVDEGRVLFANLTKGVRYYLTCKVALVLAALLPTLLGIPVPFAPIQIILMELFMDLAAAAAFVAEPSEGDLMQRPPRDPKARFMDRGMIASILTSSLGLFAAVSITYLGAWYSGAGQGTAQTMAFVTWLLGHVLLALTMRSERRPLLRLGLFSNRVMVAWGAGALVFALAATWLAPLYPILKTTSLDGAQWALIVAAVVLGTFWLEVRKLIVQRRQA